VANAESISDAAISRTLGGYAALASLILDDPRGWLGTDDDHDEDRALPGRVLHRAKDLLTGRSHPGTTDWDAQPVEERCEWWVDRIQAVAAPIAATPRVFGLAADRFPIQAAFGTAVAGLAVCAVAREHGISDPARWVPLLGRVLFDRELGRPAAADVTPPQDDGSEPPGQVGPVRRGTRALWRLTQALWDLAGIFDERPRGAWAWRVLGKIPVIGLAGGVLDERGAIAVAARETSALLAGDHTG